MSHPTPILVTALTVLVALPVSAFTQEPPALAARTCSDGTSPTGDLGYGRISCNCTHYEDEEDPTRSWWEFRSEPLIQRIRDGGPADGKLEAGDVLVAVDDLLITTRAGGRRFARIRPGDRVRLTVRRNGRERTVRITAGAYCAGDAPPGSPAAPTDTLPPGRVPQAVPVPRAVAAADAAPVVAPAPPALPIPGGLPRGWFGFSLECSDCGIEITESHTAPIWSFSSPPVIEHVEPDGPADRGGLLVGDVITHIDGVRLTSAEGGIAFGAVEPGQSVSLRFQRGGEERTTRLRAAARAAVLAPALPLGVPAQGLLADAVPPGVAAQPNVLRFAGRVGDALIRVTGGPVSVTETEREIVIRSRDITVRVSKRDTKDLD